MPDVIVPGSPVIVPSPGVNAADNTPGTSNLSRNLAMLGSSPAQQRIKRAALRGEATNPINLPLAVGVTMSIDAAADATLTRIFSGLAGGTPLTSRTLLEISTSTGGCPKLDVNGRLNFPVANTSNISGATPTPGNLASVLPDTPGYNAWGWEWHTLVTGAKAQIRQVGFTTHALRILVNGRYVGNLQPQAFPASGSGNYITLTFDTAEERLITLQGMQNDAIVSLHVPPGGSARKPSKALDRVLALCGGDSITEGTGCQWPALQAWFKVLARRMGFGDARQVGVGSTGYFSNNGGNRKTLRQQIADWPVVNSDISMADVDIVFLSAGVNDSSQTSAAAWQAEVAATISAARAMCPNALIVVTGTNSGIGGPGAVYTNLENLIINGFNLAADPRSLFIPFATAPVPPLFGTGTVAAPKADGNNDLGLNADALHPMNIGAAAIASHVQSYLVNYINAL